MQGNIFNIQRFSTQDGPGIRTTVFLKGCPLSCVWCHNPESKKLNPEIFFNTQSCINCKSCESICNVHAHTFINSTHTYTRNQCTECMKCANICPADALEVCGYTIAADKITEKILRDIEFYNNSGGGITLSGGEPLMQYEFSLEILKKAKENNIHTAIETSGFCLENLEKISKYTDLWLYDIKLIPDNEHIKYTGVSNEIILKNLYFLDASGAKIILRCPIISEINLNEKHFNSILKLVKSLKNKPIVHFEPYHPLGIEKSLRLGKDAVYQNQTFLSADEIQPFTKQFIIENINFEII